MTVDDFIAAVQAGAEHLGCVTGTVVVDHTDYAAKLSLTIRLVDGIAIESTSR